MKKLNFRQYTAEIIGTFGLVFFGCLAAVLTDDLFTTSLAFGVAVIAFAYTVGRVSGGHFNPAVTLAVLIRKKITVLNAVMYFVAQLIGATIATLFILLITNGTIYEGQFGANDFASGLTLNAFVLEAVLTCIFVFIILVVTSSKDNAKVAPIVIGLTLTIGLGIAYHFTGGSMNPTRSLIPALFTGGTALENVWVFLVAPFVGSIVAALGFILYEKTKVDPTLDI